MPVHVQFTQTRQKFPGQTAEETKMAAWHQLPVGPALFTFPAKCEHLQEPHLRRCHSARPNATCSGIDSRDECDGTMQMRLAEYSVAFNETTSGTSFVNGEGF